MSLWDLNEYVRSIWLTPAEHALLKDIEQQLQGASE